MVDTVPPSCAGGDYGEDGTRSRHLRPRCLNVWRGEMVLVACTMLLLCMSGGNAGGGTVEAFFLPGMRPNSFATGESVEVQVNVLTSVNTHLPFDFYKNLPVCHPSRGAMRKKGNIGEVLLGDRVDSAPYRIEMGVNIVCAEVCPALNVTGKQRAFLAKAIQNNYQMNYLLDGLPLARLNEQQQSYVVGVPLGFMKGKEAFLHNHLQFTIKYTEVPTDSYTTATEAGVAKEQEGNGGRMGSTPRYSIVAFVAEPLSVDYTDRTMLCTTEAKPSELGATAPLPVENLSTVSWTYSVGWEKSNNAWESRWDVYMNVHSNNVYLYYIINSTLTVLILSVVVAFIMLRSLRKDFSKYNSSLDLELDGLHEETGWKLLHRDVFRPPSLHWLLAALIGAGVQLIAMTVAVLVFAILGFFSPQSRGRLFTTFLVFFALLGSLAGLMSSRLLKLWGHMEWYVILLTGVLVPGVAFGTFFTINLVVWSQASSAAVPLGTLIAIIAMWVFVCVPLTFLGAIIGFKRDTIALPVSVSLIPRHIPKQPWYSRPSLPFAAGILPFGAVLIELYYIMDALWLNRYYYIFGFLSLVLLILAVITAEVAIVAIYFSLCAEDYKWWWRSFATGGSAGIYLFAYSILYLLSGSIQLHSFVPILLYTAYMALLSFLFSVTTGTIGFLACFLFVRYIYSSIKLD